MKGQKTYIFVIIWLCFFGAMQAGQIEWSETELRYHLEQENSSTTLEITMLEPRHLEIEADYSPIQLKEKDPVIAWLIAFPGGMLGLHRLYLGTNTQTIILYIATVGGVLGLVPMIDWILLLQGIQKGDISKYIGNKKFIMWI